MLQQLRLCSDDLVVPACAWLVLAHCKNSEGRVAEESGLFRARERPRQLQHLLKGAAISSCGRGTCSFIYIKNSERLLMGSMRLPDATEDSALWLIPCPFGGFMKTVQYSHSSVAAIKSLRVHHVRLNWPISGCLPCHTPGACACPELDWPWLQGHPLSHCLGFSGFPDASLSILTI